MKTDLSSLVALSADTEAEFDPAVAEILEGYLAGLEQGSAPDRDALLAQHPRHAEQLAQYLPWIELLYQAKPRDATAAHPAMPALLGDFRLLGELGRGGMGIVYEADQLSLGRRVAIKILPFASMLDDRQLARFKNEALAAAQLQHPRIVTIYSMGYEQGLHFYVMRLVEGPTLEQWLNAARDESPQVDPPARPRFAWHRFAVQRARARRPVPRERLRQIASWIEQAAEALDHAHQQGVVHRDIKPSNLMVGHDGELWITDFGLARTTKNEALTATGELLGTLRYMSPEQLHSKPGIVDHRTDIYSLGLTLFELIAQRPAFDGAAHQELVRQIEHGDVPPLSRFVESAPRDLDSIIQKATAKAPEARYASAQEMAHDLGAFLAGRPTMARPATWRDRGERWVRRRARFVAAAGVVLAVVLVCVVASALLVWRYQAETRRALALASENHRRAEDHFQDARHVVDDLFTGVAADLATVPGVEPVRRRLLDNALGYYQKFITQAQTDAVVRSETASAYYRCGQIREQLGEDDAAREAFGEARRIWSALPARDNDGPDRWLALCENNLGLIDFRAGRLPEAERHLRAAVELSGKWAAGRSTPGVAQSTWALAWMNLGMTLGQAGRTDEARECLQRAIELQRQIDTLAPSARGDLASSYNQLGFLSSSASPAEAEVSFRQAADEFERLCADEPDTLRWQAQLAAVINNLAALSAQAGRLDEAERQYGRSVELQERLVGRAPQVVAYARDLAVTQNNYGFLLAQRKLSGPAIEQFERARVSLAALAGAHDRSPEYASRLGAVCNNLGLSWESQGSLEQARAAFGEAIAWQRQALQISPGWAQAQAYLDSHLANLQRTSQTVESDEATKVAP